MNYRELIEKSDECTKKAIMFYEKKDWNMVKFYMEASKSYKEKALNIKID